ncbi:MAG: cytochrome c3 family protein [Candidatus Magnetomorum sp.]|nr:cytochrome c3 family protein [Candidatus Magnetomorum sp.]
MKIYFSALLMFMGILFLHMFAVAQQNPEKIQINGGFMGTISFAHTLHENAIDDCQKCHAVFPKQTGIIQDLKDKSLFKKKHVMTTLCIACHKIEKNTGPTMCNGCHQMVLNFIPAGCCLIF